jgi:putative tryptophan/tyrosine transport system substrate-binding protein
MSELSPLLGVKRTWAERLMMSANDPKQTSVAPFQVLFWPGTMRCPDLRGQMRRREFISLLSGALAAWPLAAQAQRAARPVIGFLGPASAAGFAPHLKGLREGLGEVGFVEGDSIEVEYRWADNQLDRLPALAEELLRRPVAVLVAGGASAAALAAKGATVTIPVVFAIGADPVKLGLVASMNRPGGNVTGVSFLVNALAAKQLGLLRELIPTDTVIGVVPQVADLIDRVDAVDAGVAYFARSWLAALAAM